MARLVNFVDCPAVLPAVAVWLHREFWADKPGHSARAMLEKLKHVRKDRLPYGLVAFHGTVPVGTVTLSEYPVEGDQFSDLKPWLASLYVLPVARRRGIGAELVQGCVDAAWRFGFRVLHVETSMPDFYERLGWSTFSEIPERGVVVMRREVDT